MGALALLEPPNFCLVDRRDLGYSDGRSLYLIVLYCTTQRTTDHGTTMQWERGLADMFYMASGLCTCRTERGGFFVRPALQAWVARASERVEGAGVQPWGRRSRVRARAGDRVGRTAGRQAGRQTGSESNLSAGWWNPKGMCAFGKRAMCGRSKTSGCCIMGRAQLLHKSCGDIGAQPFLPPSLFFFSVWFAQQFCAWGECGDFGPCRDAGFSRVYYTTC